MIETQSFSISYTADGAQTEWAFPYPYIASDDIKLYVVVNGVKTLVDPTYYSFDTTTNLITYPLSGDPVASGTVLYLERQTPLTQLEDSSLGNFKSNDVERMADKLTMIAQEVTKAAGELYIDDALSETSENAVQNKVITAQIAVINSGKQDIISDLNTIRSGAAAGATATQPGNNVSTLTNDAGYLTSHQDISGKANTSLNNVTGTSGFRKLTDVYVSGSSWYKVFDEYNPTTGEFVGKWCEQGGFHLGSSGSAAPTIEFLKSFSSIKSVDAMILNADVNAYTPTIHIYSVTNSDIQFSTRANGSGAQLDFYWEVKGYIA